MADRVGGDPDKEGMLEFSDKEVHILAEYELFMETKPSDHEQKAQKQIDPEAGLALGLISRMVGAGYKIKGEGAFFDFYQISGLRARVNEAKHQIVSERSAQARVGAWVKDNFEKLHGYQAFLKAPPGGVIIDRSFLDPEIARVYDEALARPDIQEIMARLDTEADERAASEVQIDTDIESLRDITSRLMGRGSAKQKKELVEVLQKAIDRLK